MFHHLLMFRINLLVLLTFCCLGAWTLQAQNLSKDFLYGACVYPEIMERNEWKTMLAHMKNADMNVTRVAESAWGLIQTSSDTFDYEWLDDYLEDAEEAGLKSILGTSTYVPPIWLVSEHPDIITVREGQRDYPLTKKNPDITHPIYQKTALQYIRKMGSRYRNHPNVLGWQLDNEIDIGLKSYIENESAEKAWQNWLANKFDSPQELNEKLQLDIFGLRVNAFDQIPLLLSKSAEWSPVGIQFNYWQYRRDMIFNFFEEQRRALGLEGTGQWITTNWTGPRNSLTNDPRAAEILDISGIDFYHPSDSRPGHWKYLGYQLDLNRSVHRDNGFLVMEVGIGVTGNTSMNQFTDWAGGAMIQQDRFFMQNVFPAAFGASGLLYWTGNRIQGSHAPYYGGVINRDGEPELEYPWVQDVGKFFKKWGSELIANPVKASVAVYTDFNQRAALEVVDHVEGSNDILVECFDVFHKIGIGVDAINDTQVIDDETLNRYSMIILATASIMGDAQRLNALRAYVKQGGTLLITPLTDYLTGNGIFMNAIGSNIKSLSGTEIKTTRMFGGPTAKDYELPRVVMKDSNRNAPKMEMKGLAEFLKLVKNTEVLARFESDATILDGYPAITRKKINKGATIKLAFWPDSDFLFAFLTAFLGEESLVTERPDLGIHIVPRTDGSYFIVNTTNETQEVSLKEASKNRIDSKTFSKKASLKPYEVLWLDRL